jgi:hypothetical protein
MSLSNTLQLVLAYVPHLYEPQPTAAGIAPVVALEPSGRAQSAAGHHRVGERPTKTVQQTAQSLPPQQPFISLPWRRFVIPKHRGVHGQVALLHFERHSSAAARAFRLFAQLGRELGTQTGAEKGAACRPILQASGRGAEQPSLGAVLPHNKPLTWSRGSYVPSRTPSSPH